MPHQPNPSDPAAHLDRVEHTVLSLLLNPETPGPWSVAEIARAVGNELDAIDALAGLHAAGLIHRCHELVFITRPAARLTELIAGL